jgi:hypothetical protein
MKEASLAGIFDLGNRYPEVVTWRCLATLKGLPLKINTRRIQNYSLIEHI